MADHGAMSAAVQRLSPARILLAVVLVAMAAGQVSNVGGFARILDTYRLFPEDVPTVGAWAFLAAETTAGVAVLRRVRWGATLATVVAVAWTVLATQAFARGLPIGNCGCFGVHFGQPLRWWVLLQDAQFVALAAWVSRAERRTSRSSAQEPDGLRLSSPVAPAGRRGRIG